MIPLLANRIKKIDQRIECLNYRQKVIRHTVKRIAIMVVDLADLIKPTPHFFKFLPLRQVSSPVDERYKNKKVENHESVFAKKPPPPKKKIKIEVEQMREVRRDRTAKKKIYKP